MSITFDGQGPSAGVSGGRPGTKQTQADQLETEIRLAEVAISQLRAFQAERLKLLAAMKIYQVDGSRSMRDWTAASLDVSHDTARALLTASKADRLMDYVSFDRAVATERLVAAGGNEHDVEWSKRFDIAGVKRLAARRRRLSRVSEEEANRDQRVRVYPNFDKSQYTLSGTLNPTGGRAVELLLDRLADELPADDDPTSRERRRAAGLVALAEDHLKGRLSGRDAAAASAMGVVNVHADANLVGATSGEAGAEIEFGPKIGPLALEELLCSGNVRIIVSQEGKPAAASHANRTIPPHTRAHVVKRDGACTISGCNSRYRLEPHHIVPFGLGGDHDPENLTTLCWYHHHVAIHQHGRRLDPESPPQNRTFLPSTTRAPPQLE